LTTAARHAFFDGFKAGCVVAAGIALAGAAFVAVFLPPRPSQSLDAELDVLIEAEQIENREAG
jgi:hypothetical protein